MGDTLIAWSLSLMFNSNEGLESRRFFCVLQLQSQLGTAMQADPEAPAAFPGLRTCRWIPRGLHRLGH